VNDNSFKLGLCDQTLPLVGRPNKERIARLRAEGLMAPAGEALIAQAVADGSWTKLDGPTALLVPDDLAAALDSLPAARPVCPAVWGPGPFIAGS
jgi:uncharacterized protein YdeI (YjbR/CyaY-like superfamily)